MHSKTRVLLSALFSIILFVPAACAGTVDQPSNLPTSGKAQTTVFMDMLRLIPATGNTTQVAYVQDYSRLPPEQRQFPPPSPTPAGYPIMQNNRFWNFAHYDPNEWESHMGFNKENIAQEAFAYRIVPMDMYEVIRGSFDKGKIESALKSDPINDDLKTVSYSGIEYFTAAEDGMTLSKRSNIRNLGQGLRLAVLGDTILTTTFTRSMQDMIDTHQKKTKSLADLDTYRQLAEGMSRLDAMAALFSSESQAQSKYVERFQDIIKDPGQDANSSFRRNIAQQVQRNVLLQAYQAMAVGIGQDAKGYYMAVALVHADEAAAVGNFDVLGKQIRSSNIEEGKSWSEAVTGVEIYQDGRLVFAKLYGQTAASHWKAFDITAFGDPLLMYKG